MTTFPRRPRFGINRSADADYSFNKVNDFYSTQLDYLIKMLLEDNVTPNLKQTLRKYLVVVCFAAMEYFFRNEASKLVDKHDLDVSFLFSQGNIAKLATDKSTTKGNIIASTYGFVNINEIDFIFSNLLGISSFLDHIVKLNVTDQTRFVLDGHPLAIEYEIFRKGYELRNEIAHDIKKVRLSNSFVIHLWDNLLNIMDISVSIFSSFLNPDENSNLQSSYEDGVDWFRTKGSYKLFSDKIFSELLKRGRLEAPSDFYTLAKEMKNSYNIEISDERIPRIISKLLREKVIDGGGNAIFLTSKGGNRYTRTRDSTREKWKRDSYGMICTWITL